MTDEPKVTEESRGELVPVEKAELEAVLPPGVKPTRNYVAAIELGHVLAASGFYPDAREPAKAAVKVMIGLDLGLSPTASLQAIHVIADKEGRVNFLVEGKLFAALIKGTPGFDYKFAPVDPDDPSKGVRRSDTEVAIDFYRNDEKQEPTIIWTLGRAKKAGLTGKGLRMYEKYPTEQLTWRCIAEGTRIHFPELIAGQPVYAQEEFAGEEGDIREALAPQTAQPLTDDRAEALRAKARAVKDEIDAINPEAVIPTRFAQAIRKAEHSHQQLENVVSGYEYLRDREAEFAELSGQLREAVPEEAEAIIERAKRRGEPQAKVDALRAALPGSDGSEGDGKAGAENGAEAGSESAS